MDDREEVVRPKTDMTVLRKGFKKAKIVMIAQEIKPEGLIRWIKKRMNVASDVL